MKPSDSYKDAMADAVEEWIRQQLPPDEARKLIEKFQEPDDMLYWRLIECTGIEMRSAVQAVLKQSRN